MLEYRVVSCSNYDPNSIAFRTIRALEGNVTRIKDGCVRCCGFVSIVKGVSVTLRDWELNILTNYLNYP